MVLIIKSTRVCLSLMIHRFSSLLTKCMRVLEEEPYCQIVCGLCFQQQHVWNPRQNRSESGLLVCTSQCGVKTGIISKEALGTANGIKKSFNWVSTSIPKFQVNPILKYLL